MSDSDIIRALAEKCMGWKLWDAYPDTWLTGEENNPSRKFWNPLSSISDAFMVVGAILARNKYFRLELQPSGKAAVSIWRNGKITTVRDDDQCRAICLAAIAALEER